MRIVVKADRFTVFVVNYILFIVPYGLDAM